MKFQSLLSFGIAAAFLTSCGGSGDSKGVDKLTTHDDSLIYALGMSTAKSMVKDQLEIKPDLVYQGMKDFQAGKTLIDENQMRSLLMRFSLERAMRSGQNPQQQQQGPDMAKAQANDQAGKAFLENHKKEAGVITTASGLQYKIIRKGAGKQPTVANTVKCNYEGTLLDGTKFDSSYDRGEPTEFPLERVIKGWQEGIPLMSVGSKFEFWIPQELGYGMMAPPNIGPNQTLHFTVELLEVK